MRIKTPKGGFGKGTGHQQRRSTVAAADVGDVSSPEQFFQDIFQGWQPGRNHEVFINMAEKTFRAIKKLRIVLVPSDALVVAESSGNEGFIPVKGGNGRVCACQKEGTGRIGQ